MGFDRIFMYFHDGKNFNQWLALVLKVSEVSVRNLLVHHGSNVAIMVALQSPTVCDSGTALLRFTGVEA